MKQYFLNLSIWRWLYCCLLFFLTACGDKQQRVASAHSMSQAEFTSTMKEVSTGLKTGDIIFRNGTDDVSRAARSMNRRDTSYSHCGLISIENDSVFVYHALGGSYNPGQKLRRDPIEIFADPVEHDRIGIYRYPLTDENRHSLYNKVREFHGRGLKFDLFFNFETDDRMYCSEFVFKVLNYSLGGVLTKYVAKVRDQLVVCPDDIFLNEHSTLVKRVDFTQ